MNDIFYIVIIVSCISIAPSFTVLVRDIHAIATDIHKSVEGL